MSNFWEDDIDAFFGDFGEPATYTSNGESPVEITVIHDRVFEASDLFGVELVSSNPVAICKTSDVPGAGNKDTLTIGGTTFYVRGPHKDYTGITVLILSLN